MSGPEQSEAQRIGVSPEKQGYLLAAEKLQTFLIDELAIDVHENPTLSYLSKLGDPEKTAERGAGSLSLNALVPDDEKVYALSHAAFHFLTGNTTPTHPTFEPFAGQQSRMRYWTDDALSQHRETILVSQEILSGSPSDDDWKDLEQTLAQKRGKLWAPIATAKARRFQQLFREPQLATVTERLLERLNDEEDYVMRWDDLSFQS